MSTVSTQPQLPKGFHIPKKMKRFILFALFFGLFFFSMSIFVKEKIRSKSHHHSDLSVSQLAEELKELRKSQEWNKKAIERLYSNQQAIINEQNELRGVKDGLIQEVSRVENIALRSHEAYRNIQARLQQQDGTINALTKGKAYNQGNSQEKNLALMELHGTQNELSNRLEAFRNILQGFEVKINTNNRKVDENLREIRNWVSHNLVSKDEINGGLQVNQNTQRQLLNEINNQKNLINQLSQNSLKQENEIKEVSKLANGLKEYTLDAVQQLAQQNANNERRINVVQNSKVSSGSMGKQGSDNGQLAVDFKNFKDYTMEALQELRAYNNKNTKRINHIQSKESENGLVAVGEMISQEVEKVLSNLGDGRLLEKILQETNISMKELNAFVNIVKMLAEGDINGVMKVLNHLTGGNFMEQLMNAKDGLLKEFKPIINILNGLSKGDGNLNDIMKYASMIGDYMGGNSQKESPSQYRQVNNNQKKQQKAQKNKEFGLQDLFEWLE